METKYYSPILRVLLVVTAITMHLCVYSFIPCIPRLISIAKNMKGVDMSKPPKMETVYEIIEPVYGIVDIFADNKELYKEINDSAIDYFEKKLDVTIQ